MTGLMDRYRAFLSLRHHLRLLLQTSNNTVYSIKEVLLTYFGTVMASRNQCCLITYIGDIRTRETWGLTSQEVNIQILIEFQGLQVYLENLLTLVEIGHVNMYLAVETTSTHQGGVQHVGTVGGGKGDDTTVRTKTVHLRQ